MIDIDVPNKFFSDLVLVCTSSMSQSCYIILELALVNVEFYVQEGQLISNCLQISMLAWI